MGVIKILSASSYDENHYERRNGNPDPNNYEIVRSLHYDSYLVVDLIYPDCENYEGRKILVYEGVSWNDLVYQGSIDPHFSDNENFHSPIARFEPTNRGWEMATNLVNLMESRECGM